MKCSAPARVLLLAAALAVFLCQILLAAPAGAAHSAITEYRVLSHGGGPGTIGPARSALVTGAVINIRTANKNTSAKNKDTSRRVVGVIGIVPPSSGTPDKDMRIANGMARTNSTTTIRIAERRYTGTRRSPCAIAVTAR